MKAFYLTTPLYYVNDVPHIGHSYTTIAADVLARWKRLRGEPVFFLTGTDEHGAKIAKAAEDSGETPQQLVDRVSGEFRRLWTALNITYDDFIRTSEPRHRAVVQKVFENLKDTGDLYKGTYEGWYCIHDETYFAESELVEKKCPQCGRDVQKLKEDTYFFKLSKYEGPLLEHYRSHPEFLSPKHRANEIINFVKGGLRDFSVSRTRVKWGIPMPFDPDHTVYVWFDALLNYVTAAGYESDARAFADRWPADVHLVGKEIYRFHTVTWPAMLMALGLPLPKKVFAHGWWTVEGTKMSKSLGNVVDPHKMVAEYGVDAYRYFLLREVPFGSDGDFSEKALLNRYNTELANNLGNLLQRTTTLLTKNFGGEIPAANGAPALLSDIAAVVAQIEKHYADLAFGDVLETIFELLVRTNKFIDEQAPWKLGEADKPKLAGILNECVRTLRVAAILLAPFMPQKCAEIWARLGERGTIEQAAPIWISSLAKGTIPAFSSGQRVEKGDPLFMRKGGKS
ncbi:MAG: methionine--tRNA ligase [Elusimicrobia bacterium]|nr:methionine--tRNA ligase [Elusimicrobiota bacterium]